MTCEQIQILLEKRSFGAANAEELQLLDEHLGGCEACRAYGEVIEATDVGSVEIKSSVNFDALREKVGKSIRYRMIRPIAYLLLVVGVTGYSAYLGFGDWVYWLMTAYGCMLIPSYFDDVKKEREKIANIVSAEDFIKTYRDDVHRHIALHLINCLFSALVGVVIMILAIFATSPMVTLSFAGFFILKSVYHGYRTFYTKTIDLDGMVN